METIYNLLEFIDLIEDRNLSSKQICEVLFIGFKIFADEGLTPDVLIKEIEQYWIKYGNVKDRPIFLNTSIDVDAYLKDNEIETPLWTEYKTTNAAIIASLHKNKGSLVGSKENNTYYLHGEPCLKFTIPYHSE